MYTKIKKEKGGQFSKFKNLFQKNESQNNLGNYEMNMEELGGKMSFLKFEIFF